jgi:hypothetical protein
LLHSNYDSQEIEYLVDGFSNVTREIIPWPKYPDARKREFA